MIEWLKTWSKGIVVAVLIATIIELILPDNTSKKYIKIIIGIFITYTIISPVITEFTGIDIAEYIESQDYIQTDASITQENEVSENSSDWIKNIYKQNLEADIKTKLEEKGYVPGEILVTISNDDNYNIEQINIQIDEKIESTNEDEKQVATIVDSIKSVKIKIGGESTEESGAITDSEKDEIKEYIKSTYDIDINKINIS